MTYDPANPNNKPNPFRNLRPEMDPKNWTHRAFVLLPEAYAEVRQRCLNHNALHRLAFITASMECSGVFIDIRQESADDAVPFPEHGERFCAIVGDRTTMFIAGSTMERHAVSVGPGAYDQASLKALFRQADKVTIDVTGTGSAPLYMAACAATAMHGKNCILIETNIDQAMHWAHFVNEFAGQAKKVLVDDEATAIALLEADAPEAGQLLN